MILIIQVLSFLRFLTWSFIEFSMTGIMIKRPLPDIVWIIRIYYFPLSMKLVIKELSLISRDPFVPFHYILAKSIHSITLELPLIHVPVPPCDLPLNSLILLKPPLKPSPVYICGYSKTLQYYFLFSFLVSFKIVLSCVEAVTKLMISDEQKLLFFSCLFLHFNYN